MANDSGNSLESIISDISSKLSELNGRKIEEGWLSDNTPDNILGAMQILEFGLHSPITTEMRTFFDAKGHPFPPSQSYLNIPEYSFLRKLWDSQQFLSFITNKLEAGIGELLDGKKRGFAVLEIIGTEIEKEIRVKLSEAFREDFTTVLLLMEFLYNDPLTRNDILKYLNYTLEK